MIDNSNKAENKRLNDGVTHQTSKLKPKIISKEIGGPKGPEPTRYGDWEKKGRCIDF